VIIEPPKPKVVKTPRVTKKRSWWWLWFLLLLPLLALGYLKKRHDDLMPLVDYITQCKRIGYPDSQIRQYVILGGYDPKLVNRALAMAEKEMERETHN